MLNLPDVTRILAQYRLHFFELDFEIVCRDVIKNQAAHAPSRLGTRAEDSANISDGLPITDTDLNEDTSRAAIVSSYRLCHVCDHKEQEHRT